MQIIHEPLNRRVILDMNADEAGKMEYLIGGGQVRPLRELLTEWLDRETAARNAKIDERIAKRLASATIAEKQSVLALLRIT